MEKPSFINNTVSTASASDTSVESVSNDTDSTKSTPQKKKTATRVALASKTIGSSENDDNK